MTYLYHSVSSSFDKNSSSLQHTDAFSRSEVQNVIRISGLKTCLMVIDIFLKLNLLTLFLLVMMHSLIILH